MTLIYWFGSDEDVEFEYEVDLDVLHDVVIEYYIKMYGADSDECRSLIEELYYNDLLNYNTDWGFEDYIRDYCYEEAHLQWKEEEESSGDPYSYFGISRDYFG